MKVAIIGAGISGLSMARLLKDGHEVTVLEQQQAAGGLIKCERVNDCLYHKVGGHVFNSRNPAVLEWFWSFFDREKEFLKAKRFAKIYFQNKIIGYPIENYIYKLSRPLVEQIVSEILELARTKPLKPIEYPNFEAFLKGNFGNTLYSIYFKPYNSKIWKTNLEEVSMEWLEGKLPMPDYAEIMLSNILREEESTMVHADFYYPVFNGSQFIADRLKEDVTIETGFKLSGTAFQAGEILLNGDRSFDKVIYTGDIRTLPAEWQTLLSENGIDLSALKALHSNGTSTLFCETDDTDISWLYIPENFTKAHRIIYTGNFSSSNNRGSERTTCVVEFSGKMEYADMIKEIADLPGNLKPLAHNYEPNSYVVQTHSTRSLISRVKKVLESNGIYLLGRFAEWEYYNMDKAIEAAMELKEKAFK